MPILTPEERIGTLVAERYRLESIIGVGGMGVVFRGLHTWTGRRVAVKLLNSEYARDETVVRRFLQEARTAARIRHANVVDVLDMGEDEDGTVFLVLELLEGETLADVLERDGALPPAGSLDLLVPVMQALVHAHRRGIVHRDIKPDNIFLSNDEVGRVIPKLLDFGIAKVVASTQSGTITGAVIGTPYYMSPEQAAGAADVEAQSDVWSMGVVLYECLSGYLPFTGSNPTAVLLSIAVGKPVNLSIRAPNLPVKLCSAVDVAIVPDRKTRYATMRDFIEALLAAARESGIGVHVDGNVKSVPPPAKLSEFPLEDPREASRSFRLLRDKASTHGAKTKVASGKKDASESSQRFDPDAPTLGVARSEPGQATVGMRRTPGPRREVDHPSRELSADSSPSPGDTAVWARLKTRKVPLYAMAGALVAVVSLAITLSSGGNDTVEAQPVRPVAGAAVGEGSLAGTSAAEATIEEGIGVEAAAEKATKAARGDGSDRSRRAADAVNDAPTIDDGSAEGSSEKRGTGAPGRLGAKLETDEGAESASKSSANSPSPASEAGSGKGSEAGSVRRRARQRPRTRRESSTRSSTKRSGSGTLLREW